MKRTIFFRFSTCFLFFIYAILIASSIVFGFQFYQFWFSGFLLVLGIIFFIRFFCYKIDSSLFLATWLFLSGFVGVLNYFFSFNVFVSIGSYLIAFSISSLTIFIKFRQIFHLKVFVFVFLCGILLVVYGINLLSLVAFVVFQSTISITILAYIVSSIKANTRKV